MMNLITIEREYGSGGGVIAQKLAARLEWKLWDEELTNEIARAMGLAQAAIKPREERRDPLYYRLLKSFMLGTFEGNPHAAETKVLDADTIYAVTQKIMTRLSQSQHSVIVGRGGAYFMHDRLGAYHVFVYASPKEKVRRLRERGIREEEAVQQVVSVDAERAAFIKNYFNVEWPTRSRYHMMVNSDIGDDAVIQTILDSIDILEKSDPVAEGRYLGNGRP
jgi:cytidylate kinase